MWVSGANNNSSSSSSDGRNGVSCNRGDGGSGVNERGDIGKSIDSNYVVSSDAAIHTEY